MEKASFCKCGFTGGCFECNPLFRGLTFELNFGESALERSLRKAAEKAPGIEKIWEMTKNLPSLTEILLEERGCCCEIKSKKPKKKLWGLLKGIRINEEDIEKAKKSLFPKREF